MTAVYDQLPSSGGEQNVSQIERLRSTVEQIASLVGVPLEHPRARREDTPLPEGYINTPEKEQQIRQLSEALGIGCPYDITPEMAGAPTERTTIVEAGLVWKMQAELDIALKDGNGPIIMGGSRFEQPNDAELEKLALISGKTVDDLRGMTQYDAAYMILASQQGFELAENTAAIDAKRAASDTGDVPIDFDGQGDILYTGTINGRDMYMYDVPRRQDPEKPGKFQAFKASDILEHISANDLGGNDICLVTSTTYIATRAIECDKATERGVSGVFVAGYGQETLAVYKSGGVPKPVAMNQILAEVAATANKLG